jgi:exopolysaccharide production protein ExoQ
MIPLMFLSIGGAIRFNTHSHNNALEASYTSLMQSDGPEGATHKMVFFLCGLLLCTRIRGAVSIARNNKIFVALSMIAVVSTAWSQFPTETVSHALYATMNIAFAFYIVARFTPHQQMQLFLFLGWVVVLSCMAAALLVPQYGVDHQGGTAIGAWIGIFNHKNWCAIMAEFLVSGAFYMRPASSSQKAGRIVYIALSLFLVVMSQSRTGWLVAGCLLPYIAITTYLKRYRAKDILFIAVLCGGAAAVSSTLLIRYYAAIMGILGKDPTLTGRTKIWSLVLVSIMKHPLLGYGYRGYWHGLQGESANVSLADHWIVPAAHNGFLDLWLGLGAVGVGIVIYSMFQAVRNGITCLRRGPSASAEWYLCIVFLTLVSNVAELTLMVPDYLAWIMYVIACVGLSQEATRARLDAALHRPDRTLWERRAA